MHERVKVIRKCKSSLQRCSAEEGVLKYFTKCRKIYRKTPVPEPFMKRSCRPEA